MKIYNLNKLLSQFWTSLLFHVCSNCCFFTCIQVSLEAGKVDCYYHLFKNFPEFVVIHTVKGFSLANEREVNPFLEFLCFSYDPTDVGNLFSACSKSNLYIWKFLVHLTWNLTWILSIILLACKMSTVVKVDWAFLVAQLLKNLSTMQETLVWTLGGENPVDKGYTTPSSIVRLPW